jgi:cholesterol transport system auxiliary component
LPAALCAAWLAACSGSSPLATFTLSAASAGLPARPVRQQLAVLEPHAAPPLDGDRIVVRTGAESVAFLSGAQWSDRLPRLVQTRLIQTFENAHSLRSVGRPDDKMIAEASLQLEIRRFEMDVESGQAVVEISAKLIQEGSGRVGAAKIFSARTPGPADDGGRAAAALDASLAQVMRQIVAWTVTRA